MSDWVLDVTSWDERGIRVFCPYENGAVITGLAWITDRPDGRIVGIFHEDGPEAAEAWCDEHPNILAELKA